MRLRSGTRPRAGCRRATPHDANRSGLPTMPYHHESLGMREAEANVLIARVRRSIAACTARALTGVVTELAPCIRSSLSRFARPTFPALPETVAAVRPVISAAMRRRRDDVSAGAVSRRPSISASTCSLCRRGEEAHAGGRAARGSTLRTSTCSSAPQVVHRVRHGPRSTGARMRPASPCSRARVVASTFRHSHSCDRVARS